MARGGKKHKKDNKDKKKKRNRDDLDLSIDDSDAEDGGQQKAKKQKSDGANQGRKLEYNLPVPDWTSLLQSPVNNNVWIGSVGEDPPSEELKLARKNIGVNVKGNLTKCPAPILSVEDAALPSIFKQYFAHHGLSNPTSVQQQCWPCILSGANVLGIAPTGSGKTLGYLLPAFSLLESRPSSSKSLLISPSVLVLVPTRELALQVLSVAKSFRPFSKVRCGVLYGGHEKETQLEDLQQYGSSLKVLIATPGRLLDVLGSTKKTLQLATVTYTVIDEADRMLSLGFQEQLTAVLSQIRPDKQIVLFSATFPGNLRNLSEVWAPNSVVVRCNAIDLSNIKAKPQLSTENSNSETLGLETKDEVLAVDPEESQLEANTFTSSITISPTVNQLIHICAPHKRPRLLIKYIERIREEEKKTQQRQASPMIIFCNTIKTLKFVMEFLNRQHLASVPLHGQLPQQKREENLLDLKSVSKFYNLFCFCNLCT